MRRGTPSHTAESSLHLHAATASQAGTWATALSPARPSRARSRAAVRRARAAALRRNSTVEGAERRRVTSPPSQVGTRIPREQARPCAPHDSKLSAGRLPGWVLLAESCLRAVGDNAPEGVTPVPAEGLATAGYRVRDGPPSPAQCLVSTALGELVLIIPGSRVRAPPAPPVPDCGVALPLGLLRRPRARTPLRGGPARFARRGGSRRRPCRLFLGESGTGASSGSGPT